MGYCISPAEEHTRGLCPLLFMFPRMPEASSILPLPEELPQLNQADGGLACWIMNNGQMQESTWIGIKPAGQTIAGIWDVNGDGTDDVVLSVDTGYEAWTIKDGKYSGIQLLA